MALARNKKREPDATAIAAFGAAAETRSDEAAPTASPARGAQSSSLPLSAPSMPTQSDGDGPKASLVRWAGEKQLRDDLIAYGKLNRYNMQELMIEAMRRGLDDMKTSDS